MQVLWSEALSLFFHTFAPFKIKNRCYVTQDKKITRVEVKINRHH